MKKHMFQINLKILREKSGLSQAVFAKNLNIAQSTVGMWESGKREPDFTTIQKLADYFNVSVDYLLGRTEKKEPMCEHMSFDDFSKIMAENGVTEDKIKKLSDEQMKLIAMTINNFNNNK